MMELLPLGISYGAPRDQYDADPGYRQSTLKAFGKARTPAHFAFGIDKPMKDTPSLRIGNYVDSAIHGTAEETASKFAIWEERRQGAAWKKFQAANKHKSILNKTEADDAANCIMSLTMHEDTQRILAVCHKQTAIIAQHPVLGFRLKGLVDLIPSRVKAHSSLWPYLFDIKISEDASPEGFSEWCYHWGYHVQAYHYIKLAEYCGVMIDAFAFIVVETMDPQLVKIHFINRGSPEYNLAEQLTEEWLPRYHEAVTKNLWPGYGSEWSAIRFKPWQLKKFETERELLQ